MTSSPLAQVRAGYRSTQSQDVRWVAEISPNEKTRRPATLHVDVNGQVAWVCANARVSHVFKLLHWESVLIWANYNNLQTWQEDSEVAPLHKHDFLRGRCELLILCPECYDAWWSWCDLFSALISAQVTRVTHARWAYEIASFLLKGLWAFMNFLCWHEHVVLHGQWTI